MPAFGQDTTGSVRMGADAFGGWQDDAPGVTRHITAKDLEAPNASPSASNSPGGVDRQEDTMPQVPDGFKVELVASGIDNPRAIRFSPNGDLFIANSSKNQVLVLRTMQGAAAKPQVFVADGLHQPYGIAFYPPGNDPQWIYIANSNGLIRFPYKSGDLKPSGSPEAILSDIPASHHWTRDVVFSPDGKTMYYSVGSGSNVAEGMGGQPDGWAAAHALGATWGNEARRADVLAFDPDGKNERIVATGLRNCAGMTLQPATGNIWCVVNERDNLGNNVPFEYATAVQQGAFYGWPWYYIGGNEDPRHANERPDLKDKVAVPDVLMQAHSAPLNIAFYDNDAWGPDYKGDAFVALHGSWNRGTRTGYKIVRLLFDDNGKPTGEYQDFMTGFVTSDRDVWGRPVGVTIAKDGSLYVSEDGSGTIWKVTKE
ncbi:MAG TPA: PQQ-dependent sugar dehydrogenase [Devosiaceae bacterium]